MTRGVVLKSCPPGISTSSARRFCSAAARARSSDAAFARRACSAAAAAKACNAAVRIRSGTKQWFRQVIFPQVTCRGGPHAAQVRPMNSAAAAVQTHGLMHACQRETDVGKVSCEAWRALASKKGPHRLMAEFSLPRGLRLRFGGLQRASHRSDRIHPAYAVSTPDLWLCQRPCLEDRFSRRHIAAQPSRPSNQSLPGAIHQNGVFGQEGLPGSAPVPR